MQCYVLRLKGLFSCSLMIVLFECYFCVSLHKGADIGNMYGVYYRECMFYGVIGKFGGSWYRLSVILRILLHLPHVFLGIDTIDIMK